MSLQHFFLDNQIVEQAISASDRGVFALDLSREDMKHVSALRLTVGEHIGVIDASGTYFECEICQVAKECVDVTVCKHSMKSSKSIAEKPQITLAFGMLKGTKADEVIRGCTEIGVDKFIPVEFERCVSRPDTKSSSKKVERWQKIAKSACMQSGQYRLAKVDMPKSLHELCKTLSEYDHVVVFWEQADVDILTKLQANVKPTDKIAVVIGPEGGISESEINALTKANKCSYIATMGESILRAQTACVVGCGIVSYLCQG